MPSPSESSAWLRKQPDTKRRSDSTYYIRYGIPKFVRHLECRRPDNLEQPSRYQYHLQFILCLMDTLAGNVFGNEREDLHRRTGLAYLVLDVLFVLGETAR